MKASMVEGFESIGELPSWMVNKSSALTPVYILFASVETNAGTYNLKAF
jgi:hypothetical protein